MQDLVLSLKTKIFTPNLDETRDFYERVFGMLRVEEWDDPDDKGVILAFAKERVEALLEIYDESKRRAMVLQSRRCSINRIDICLRQSVGPATVVFEAERRVARHSGRVLGEVAVEVRDDAVVLGNVELTEGRSIERVDLQIKADRRQIRLQDLSHQHHWWPRAGNVDDRRRSGPFSDGGVEEFLSLVEIERVRLVERLVVCR